MKRVKIRKPASSRRNLWRVLVNRSDGLEGDLESIAALVSFWVVLCEDDAEVINQ